MTAPAELPVPAYRLTVGRATVDTAREPRASTVVAIAAHAGLDTPSATATVVLGHAGRLAAVPGDAATLALGYAGPSPVLTTVLTGTVVRVESGLRAMRLEIQDAGAALLRSYADLTYEGRTAGELVTALARAAGVSTGAVEDGETFPAYVIDGRRSAAHHLRDLADLCGVDVYLDAADRLVFRKWAGGAQVHVYEHGKHLLELDLHRADPAWATVSAWGESPGLGRGSTAWAWVTKDFAGSAFTAPTGPSSAPGPALLLERSALRTASAAQTAAGAAATRAARDAQIGRLRGVGRPEVALGDAVELRGVPTPGADGTYQVRAVAHRLTRSAGFTTTVDVRSQVVPPSGRTGGV